MYLTIEKKKEIFKRFGKSSYDTGSCEGQIALLTYRIKHLTEHLKSNKKDLHTQRSLLNMVGKRRGLLDYIKRQNIERYRDVIGKLGIRK